VLEPAVVAGGKENDVVGLNLDVDGIHPSDETRKDR
jgi:hypothetical protein